MKKSEAHPMPVICFNNYLPIAFTDVEDWEHHLVCWELYILHHLQWWTWDIPTSHVHLFIVHTESKRSVSSRSIYYMYRSLALGCLLIPSTTIFPTFCITKSVGLEATSCRVNWFGQWPLSSNFKRCSAMFDFSNSCNTWNRVPPAFSSNLCRFSTFHLLPFYLLFNYI